MTHRLETAFTAMIDHVGLGHLSKESTQIIEMRRAFYGGAAVMFSTLTADLPDMDEDSGVAMIEEYSQEIDNFAAGIQIGER